MLTLRAKVGESFTVSIDGKELLITVLYRDSKHGGNRVELGFEGQEFKVQKNSFLKPNVTQSGFILKPRHQ